MELMEQELSEVLSMTEKLKIESVENEKVLVGYRELEDRNKELRKSVDEGKAKREGLRMKSEEEMFRLSQLQHAKGEKQAKIYNLKQELARIERIVIEQEFTIEEAEGMEVAIKHSSVRISELKGQLREQEKIQFNLKSRIGQAERKNEEIKSEIIRLNMEPNFKIDLSLQDQELCLEAQAKWKKLSDEVENLTRIKEQIDLKLSLEDKETKKLKEDDENLNSKEEEYRARCAEQEDEIQELKNEVEEREQLLEKDQDLGVVELQNLDSKIEQKRNETEALEQESQNIQNHAKKLIQLREKVIRQQVKEFYGGIEDIVNLSRDDFLTLRSDYQSLKDFRANVDEFLTSFMKEVTTGPSGSQESSS